MEILKNLKYIHISFNKIRSIAYIGISLIFIPKIDYLYICAMPYIIYNLFIQFLAKAYLIKSFFKTRVGTYIKIVDLALIWPV